MPQISNPQASSQISPDVLVSSCLCEVKLLRSWSVINDGSTFSSWFEWVSVVLRSSLIGGNWMGNVSASLEWEHSGGGKKRTGRNTHNTARASLRTSPSSRVAVFYHLTKPTWARTLFSPPSRGWCLEKRRNNMNRMNVRHCCSNSGKIRWKEQWGWLVFVCVFACSPSLHCVVWIMIWPGSDSIGDVHLYLTLVVSRSCH